MMSLRKSLATLVLIVFLPTLFIQMINVGANDQSAPERVLQFLTDVAMLDMKSYDTRLVYYRDYSSVSSQFDEAVKYNLTSPDDKIEVIGIFRNHVLISCNLNVIKGSPRFIQPSVNSLDSARLFFERYQNYSKASYLAEMRSILNTISDLVPMTKTVGNVKLDVSFDNGRTLAKWTYTVNGIDVSYNSMSVGFRYGGFEGFSDDWNRYEIGTSDVKISREEAIRIAKLAAYNSTFVVGGSTVTIDYTILDEPVITTLTMQPKTDNRLYPLWEIKLVLDRVILGSTGGFQVALWADTGEVCFVTSTGMLGVPTEENNTTTPVPSTEPSTPTPSPSPQSSHSPSPEPSSTTSPTQTAAPSQTAQSSQQPAGNTEEAGAIDSNLLIAVVAASAVAAATVSTALFLRKRRKTT